MNHFKQQIRDDFDDFAYDDDDEYDYTILGKHSEERLEHMEHAEQTLYNAGWVDECVDENLNHESFTPIHPSIN